MLEAMRKSEMLDGRDLHAVPISDAKAVRAILVEAARERRPISYANVLDALGHRFSRPKMRALCKTLDAVDRMGMEAGEPELAVLVVRDSDKLPGQGWWVSCAQRLGYEGLWTGPAAVKFIRAQQERVFDYWSPRPLPVKKAKGASTAQKRLGRRRSRP
jgi:hypothetical protein